MPDPVLTYARDDTQTGPDLIPVAFGDLANKAIRVNLVAGGGAGGGAAQLQVRNVADAAWVNIGVAAEGATTLHVPIRIQGTGANVIEPLNVAPVGTEYALPVRTVGGAGGGPATIADGADVAEGATADAAVITDVAGTISGKLRGLVKMLADMWDATNHRLNVFIQNASIAVTGALGRSWTLASGTDSVAVTGTVTADVSDRVNRILGTAVVSYGSGSFQVNPSPVTLPPLVTAVGASQANVTLLSPNAKRRTLVVTNDTVTGRLRLKCGAGARADSYTVLLKPGDSWSPPGVMAYQEQVDGVWDIADGLALVTEFVDV